MIRLYILFIPIVLIGCLSKQSNTQLKDSTELDQSKSQTTLDTIRDENSESLEVKIDTSIYRVEKTIDTTCSIGKDVINVRVISKFDSSKVIDIPRKYLDLVGVRSFTTYDTWYKVLVVKNSKVVVDTSLSKLNFKALADSSLQWYGVLVLPNIKIYRDSLYIGFSYSVPLSDVGVYAPVTLKFYE